MKKSSGRSVFYDWAICCDEEPLFHIKKRIPTSTWMQSHTSRPLPPTQIQRASLVQECAHYVKFKGCKTIGVEALCPPCIGCVNKDRRFVCKNAKQLPFLLKMWKEKVLVPCANIFTAFCGSALP